MRDKTTYKISLPDSIPNPSYSVREIEVNGEKHRFWNAEPEFLSLKDKSQEALKTSFLQIERIAFSDAQLKSINDFFLENYSRLCDLRLHEGSRYNEWKVYKRYDDILFVIEDVDTTSGKMRLDVTKYQFPFMGGVVNLSDSNIISPEDFDFEYQFHLYNMIEDE